VRDPALNCPGSGQRTGGRAVIADIEIVDRTGNILARSGISALRRRFGARFFWLRIMPLSAAPACFSGRLALAEVAKSDRVAF